MIADPDADVDADLSTRAGQLAWAAGLGFASQSNPPGTIGSHAIWRTLVRHPQLAGSLGAAARYVDLSITNRNATMDWGAPGSWFWFAPDKNHINIDLFFTLLTGFGRNPMPGTSGYAHAIAVKMHEVLHSQWTVRFTDKMIALQKREAELLDASKQRKLSRDEYKELARIRMEFQLRMNLLNAAEDNCVNEGSARTGLEFPHDFRESLNICNVLLQGSGLYLKRNADKSANLGNGQDAPKQLAADPRQKEIEEASEALGNLNKALALAFYSTNGLFDTADVESWKKLGVDPDDIRAENSTNGAATADSFLGKESDFDRLMGMVIGPNGIANQQTSSRDRWLLRSVFARNVQSYADRRCRIMEDIWDKYAARYAKTLIDAAEQNAENAMNKKKNDQKNKDKQDQDKKQEQQGEQDQPGNDGGSPQTNPADLPPEKNQGGADGSESPGSVDVDGVGKMGGDGDGEPLPATPEDVRKAQRKAAEDGIKPEDAQTVRDLARDARLKERGGAPGNDAGKPGGQGGDAPAGRPGDLNIKPDAKGGRAKGIDLAKLSKGSWKEFRKRINEMEPIIARVAQDFQYIRNQQRQTVRSISRDREELPRGGDIRERLDMRAHMNLAIKRATGQQIEAQDRKRWRVDQVSTESTSAELWILGDGSISMKTGLPGGGRRIDSAVQSMAILYEAGRRADFDTFAGMWGDDKIRLLARPGDADQKVGENFERVRNGIDSGTQLSPSFAQAIGQSARQEVSAAGRQKRFAGMTHFLIISDGELNSGDIEPTVNMILKLFRYGPAVSVDIAVLGGTGSEMNQVVTKVKAANPAAAVSLIKADSAREIPILLAQRIKRRFEQSSKDFLAIPDAEKREAFSRVERALKLK